VGSTAAAALDAYEAEQAHQVCWAASTPCQPQGGHDASGCTSACQTLRGGRSCACIWCELCFRDGFFLACERCGSALGRALSCQSQFKPATPRTGAAQAEGREGSTRGGDPPAAADRGARWGVAVGGCPPLDASVGQQLGAPMAADGAAGGGARRGRRRGGAGVPGAAGHRRGPAG